MFIRMVDDDRRDTIFDYYPRGLQDNPDYRHIFIHGIDAQENPNITEGPYHPYESPPSVASDDTIELNNSPDFENDPDFTEFTNYINSGRRDPIDFNDINKDTLRKWQEKITLAMNTINNYISDLEKEKNRNPRNEEQINKEILEFEERKNTLEYYNNLIDKSFMNIEHNFVIRTRMTSR